MEASWARALVEGLFVRGLRDELDPSLRLALLQVGVDVSHPASLTPQQLEAGLRVVGARLHPNASWFDQSLALGARAVTGYFDTLLGHAMATALRVVGPERSLRRVGTSFKSICTTVELTILEPGRRDALLRIRHAGALAPFVLGLMDGSSVLLSAGQARARFEREEGEDLFARLTW